MRRSNGTPAAANSLRMDGLSAAKPTPRMIRPSAARSSVPTTWASTTGLRSAGRSTPVPRRTRRVRPATAAISVSGSWRGRAISESPIQTESKPAASARSAIARSGAVSGRPDMTASRVGISTPNSTAMSAPPGSRPPCYVALPPSEQPSEHRAVLEAVALGVLGGVLLDAVADRRARRHVEARNLALVTDQRGDLPIDRLGDVDDDVGLVGAPVPELAHLVRLEAVPREVLREMQIVPGVGIHGVRRGDSRLAVIAVLEPFDPIWVVDEHRVRPVPADRTHDVAQEPAGVLEPAVGVAEHDDVPHAHEVAGGALLGRPFLGQRSWRQRAVGGARRAVRAEDVGHLAARRRPLGHHATRADLGVVGMGEDHHRFVRHLGYDLELAGGGVSGHAAILQDGPRCSSMLECRVSISYVTDGRPRPTRMRGMSVSTL